jgi:hypothetical protein
LLFDSFFFVFPEVAADFLDLGAPVFAEAAVDLALLF